MSDGAHDAMQHRDRTRDARWLRDELLGAIAAAAAAGECVDAAPPPPSTPPRQDPAFPAAFVFRSHSALYLAAEAIPSSARRDPA